MADSPDLTGLDHAFLRYIGVNPTDQRRNQGFYLQFFTSCRQVVDLGCGDGDFVQLLIEQGIQAVGVDKDPVAVEHLRQENLPIIDADAVGYLETAEAASLDGIFAAHLVEHMPYEAVYGLMFHAYRTLKPGGRIVLVTPNVRGLVSHLEMYWMHFGHVSFYHPRLLCFFLHSVGFDSETWGENPSPAHPIFGDLAQHWAPAELAKSAATQVGPLPLEVYPRQAYQHDAPVRQEVASAGKIRVPPVQWSASVPRSRLSAWRNFLRVRLARLLGLDDALHQVNTTLSLVSSELATQSCELSRVSEGFATISSELVKLSQGLNAEMIQRAQVTADVAAMIERVDRPFECYATAIKPAN